MGSAATGSPLDPYGNKFIDNRVHTGEGLTHNVDQREVAIKLNMTRVEVFVPHARVQELRDTAEAITHDERDRVVEDMWQGRLPCRSTEA